MFGIFITIVTIMPKKSRQIGIRFDEKTFDRLQAVEDSTGVEKVAIARLAAIAAIEYFEEAGELYFPLKIIPKNKRISGSTQGIHSREEPPEYRIDPEREPFA